jgi:hypothetical protein
MAQDDRDHMSADRAARPSLLRIALGALALASIGYGVSLLFQQPKVNRPFEVIKWAIGSDIVVDGLLIPASIVVGFVLTKVLPGRARRFVQGGLIAAVGVILVALPLIHRRGQAQPGQALLLQNYQLNLAVLLGLIAAATALAYLARVVGLAVGLGGGQGDQGDQGGQPLKDAAPTAVPSARHDQQHDDRADDRPDDPRGL